MTECKECGSKVAPDEHFCGNCGAQLPAASPALETIAVALDADSLTSIAPKAESKVDAVTPASATDDGTSKPLESSTPVPPPAKEK